MSVELLIAHDRAEARIATRAGSDITAGRFIADATAFAERLPASRYVLNTCHDRYAFTVAFAAALIAGRTNLLPPSRTPDMLAQLAQRYPDTAYVGDEAGNIWYANSATPRVEEPLDAIAAGDAAWPPPSIAREHTAAIAFTSGSTGEPQPQLKTWGGIVDGARAEATALRLADARIEDVIVLGTVSPQHMYGLESTVMMPLHGPCALAAEHPLHAHEVSAALSNVSGSRVLITTPVHLRALSESKLPMPAIDRVVSATAPLTAELAARCEALWNTQVFEIYGCTETGMVAARRTVDGPQWTAMRDVKIEQRGDQFFASGGHVKSGQLADRLKLLSQTSFELEGRADDVVNIGGKRASLQGLNSLLLTIDGVVDGVIFLPADNGAAREPRLAAAVVAPGYTRAQLLALMRTQMDAAFLPRPLLLVDALPRNAQGKLPRAELLQFVERTHGRARARQPARRRAVAS